MKTRLSVIILTYNECLHIRRCLERIRPLASEVFVVDCHSTDGTQAIARELSARPSWSTIGRGARPSR